MAITYKHWRIDQGQNYTTVYFDQASSPINMLNHETMSELSALLRHVAAMPKLKGVVFRSAKTKGFIAGADVSEFKKLTTVNDAIVKVREGQQVFTQIARLPVPTIAVIHDFALGGGLEFALACDYRICDDNPDTRLGLLEVLVGIHPGWGGTTRLPTLVGALAALDLMLTGRTINGTAAKAIGLVDYAIPTRDIDRAIDYLLLMTPPVHQPTLWQRLLGFAPMRPIVGGFLRRRLAAKVKETQYPAPFALLNLWQRFGGHGDTASVAEANSVAKLMVTSTAQQLVRVFFLREHLKGLGTGQFHGNHVHVVGAGTMGGDIAAWCALRGFKVTLEDTDLKQLGKSIGRANVLFTRKLKQKHRIQSAQDRLIIDASGFGRTSADVIIEAIVEDKAIKHALWQTLVKQAKPDALLATNTSSISLAALTEGWIDPNRLVGLHFFNPVAHMPLVEVVEGSNTDPNVVARALTFVKSIDKLPLPVSDEPGFLVNRVLSAYMLAAINLAMEGQSYAAIDGAALAYGMPMGPIELADTVGLDVCLAAAEELAQHLSVSVPKVLKDKVKAGQLGRKSGLGFYRYSSGKRVEKIKIPAHVSNTLVDELMQPLITEAKAALEAGIVSEADLVDAGMVFGAGFPPFRGGPLQEAQPEPLPHPTVTTPPNVDAQPHVG